MPSVNGDEGEIILVPIARWRAYSNSYPDYLGPFQINPVKSFLTIEFGKLKSVLARRGSAALYPKYRASLLSSQDLDRVVFPGTTSI